MLGKTGSSEFLCAPVPEEVEAGAATNKGELRETAVPLKYHRIGGVACHPKKIP
jgi:hypothetical protein